MAQRKFKLEDLRPVETAAQPRTFRQDELTPAFEEKRGDQGRSASEIADVIWNTPAVSLSHLVGPGPGKLRNLAIGGLEIAEGMTSPGNLLLNLPVMLGTGAFGGTLSAASRTAIGRLISGGFSIDLVRNAYTESKEFRRALE